MNAYEEKMTRELMNLDRRIAMTNQEKIDKAMVLIRRCGIKNKRTTSDEVYELMRNYTLDDLAEELEMFINLVYGIRAVLEGE